MKQKFLVVYEFANGSYSGYAPDLPGCIATGDTYEQVREKMRDAVETHVSFLVEQGNDVQHWRIEQLKIEVPVAERATNE
jgi:predicted RNase H-like HicB family nuclease